MGQSATYSLFSNPGGLFTISLGGILVTNVAIVQAVNPSVILQITATDNGSPTQSFTQTFVIIVNYVARAPGVSNTSMSVPENSPVGALVGTMINSRS